MHFWFRRFLKKKFFLQKGFAFGFGVNNLSFLSLQPKNKSESMQVFFLSCTA
jgi:hypothetical protein